MRDSKYLSNINPRNDTTMEDVRRERWRLLSKLGWGKLITSGSSVPLDSA
jgi:hypothetical protein